MVYRPEISFWSDSDEITEDVVAFEFRHGVNILFSKTGPDRAESGGRMLLENFDGYWTPALLDGLGVIEMRWGTEVLARAAVFEHEFDKQNGLVAVTLQSTGEDTLKNEVDITATAEVTAADVIAASGVTVTPEAPLGTDVKMDQGATFMGDAEEFADGLAVFLDGYVYENHLGELRALEKSDSRQASLHINPANFDIEEASAVSFLRRRWRRDAQNIETLGITLIAEPFRRDDQEVISTLGSFRYSVIGSNRFRVYFKPYSHLTEDQQARFRFYNNYSPIVVELESTDYTYTVSINPNDTTELFFELNANVLPPDDRPGPTVAEQRAWVRTRRLGADYSINIMLLPTVFDVHPARLTAGDRLEHGLAPDMPWAISESSVPHVQARLVKMATEVPRVTKLVFPIVQETEARFRELVEHRIGSISDMFLQENDLSIHGIMANLFIRWSWELGRYNSVEMHFLQLRDPPADYRLVRLSEDNPIFRIDDMNPLYRGIA